MIAKHQKKQTVTALRQAYNLLHQATELAKIDHGQPESWNFDTSATIFMDTYITPYLKNIQISNRSPYSNTPTWSDGMSKGWILNFTYNGYFIHTPQGYIYSAQRYGGSDHIVVFIDIDGTKGANRVGKDIFLVGYSTENKRELKMEGHVYNKTSYQHCNKKTGNGGACGLKIERDGWQINDDYPWF